ncbi:DNA-binding transcriptional regulator, MarR family [Aureimonas altamirensis DSM 21988]|uniref:DNA-binding transcriptional regulator, MarR family n=1 Tax=Aureimonas altamirensis DSM 21988 TaxID=1121026 RepID=A0ABY1IQF9_9HYPH|nr:MarR family winged helix-turn-helix transcriptional regulator [Aureimonas altamirensis]SHJ90986.1 DNA-binding transcriptional regulator, MarR family [Aureimonas altamirensis DSM 21988]
MKKGKTSILRQLTVTARAERQLLAQHLAGLGLHPGQDALLLSLAAQDGQSLAELAANLRVSAPTITKTVGRMSAEGFLEKRASTEDRRQNFAFLTDSGRLAASAARRAQRDMEEAALAGFSQKQRRRLRKLLAKMARNLAPAAQESGEDEAASHSSVA